MFLLLLLFIPTMTITTLHRLHPVTTNITQDPYVSMEDEGKNSAKVSTKKAVYRYCPSYNCSYKAYHPCCGSKHKKKLGNETDNLVDRFKSKTEFIRQEGPKKLQKK